VPGCELLLYQIKILIKKYKTDEFVDNLYSFYEDINEVVQEEPVEASDPETLGLLAAIGIE
jgi:hypothetical protein